MFCFLCRISVVHGRQAITASQSYKLFYLLHSDPNIFRLSTTLRFMSVTPSQQSFTVSYLIKKLGFSPKSALAASNYVHLKTPAKPDSIISFFKKHGFSESQIKKMLKKSPNLLLSDAEKTILPKLKFLLSKGFSSPDLTKFLSCWPTVLLRSLDRHIIPFFNTYSNLVHSDEKTVKAIKSYPYLISYDMNVINGDLLSNINLLRDHGIPEPNIIKTLHQFPGTCLLNPGSLKEIVEKVEETGLDPMSLKFICAVRVLAGMSKSTMERKVDVFKKWGWSDKEIQECFRKYPLCFAISEEMIMAKMDFVVNKMGVDSSRVINQPSFITQSLEKRIVPRGLLAQHLLSKGLIRGFKLSALFDSSENWFLKTFVKRHEAEAPELLELYKEKFKKY